MTTDLDIRQLRRGRWLAELVARFEALPVGGSVVVTGESPQLDQLHRLFDRDWAGAHDWQQLGHDTGGAQDQVTKTAAGRLPRVLTDTTSLPDTSNGGAVWTLQPSDRQLDANIIHLPPGDRIDAPTGSDLDVLVTVLHGDGELDTESGPVALAPGHLAWLPRGSRRTIIAGSAGLTYLTVHTRRAPMAISRHTPEPPPART